MNIIELLKKKLLVNKEYYLGNNNKSFILQNNF